MACFLDTITMRQDQEIDMTQLDRISQRPEVMGGKPCNG